MIDLLLVICFFKSCLLHQDLNLSNKDSSVILLAIYTSLAVIFLFMFHHLLDAMIALIFYLLADTISHRLAVVKIAGAVPWRK